MTPESTGRGVVCAGLVTLDVIADVASYPRANEKVVGQAQRIEVGGPATNAARTAAALGLPVTLVAPFGRSPVADMVADQLHAAGIDWVDPVAAEDNPSPISVVIVHPATGDRAVISGGGPALRSAWTVPESLLMSADAVLIDGHGGRLPGLLAAAAGAHGIPVLLDGGSYKAGMADYLPDVDFALLSADFAAPDGSDPCVWARSQGARAAARSDGAGPIRLVDAAGESLVPVPATTPVDTNAAGDVLHGALLAALAVTRGDSRMYAESLAFAARVASASVRYAGALGWSADLALAAALRAELRSSTATA